MKKQIFSLLCLMVAMTTQAQTVTQTKYGVKVDASKAGVPTTEVTVYTPSIIRVTKYADGLKQMPAKKSYSVILEPTGVDFQMRDVESSVAITTEQMTVTIDKQTGVVCFAKGQKMLLQEVAVAEVKTITTGADKGKYEIAQNFRLDKDEAIFGFGQRGSRNLNQRGEKIKMWNTNGNITIPYFASDKGYGFYWDNAGRSRFEDSENLTRFTSEVAQGVDYYFIYGGGSQDAVMASVRQLSGQATMFPLWSMGFWQCRERYKTSDELCEVLDKYRELEIPLDGIVQDWQYWGCDSNWNAMKFMNPYYINKVGDEQWAKYLPDDLKPLAKEYVEKGLEPRIKSPQEMVDYVHSKNAHLMISIWASFGPWTEQYKELEKIGALYPFDTWPRNRGVKPYDPFNPKARDIYWKYLKNLYDMDIDAWWSDSTEPDQFDQSGDDEHMTNDGTWRSVKNAFPLMSNKGVYENLRKQKKNNKRSFQMTRSSSFGIQRYATFSWSGDITSNWQVMKAQIPSGLNYVTCGIPFWNTDIGGFFGWDINNDTHDPFAKELQVRWMQWGCFMPLMRNHRSGPMLNELYHYGKPGEWAFDVQKDFIELRYRLLPYIYSMMGEVVQRSGSMMRPLFFDFAHDKRAINLTDEYLFGRSILVKPVTDPLYTFQEGKKGFAIYPELEKAAAPVSVYLPSGADWYDFWTNELVAGGRSIKRLAPISLIPVYVKAGSILPFGPAVQYSTEKPWDNLEIRVYPGANGEFVLYEDEGDNYNYEKGAFSEIPFRWDNDHGTLIIGARKGKFKGMLGKRNFRIHLVTTDSPAGDTEATTYNAVVAYEGKEVRVKLCEGIVPDGREDVSHLIANPSFEVDGRSGDKLEPQGWTVNSPTSWWGINGHGSGEPKATHGNYIFGVWDEANTHKATISQVLKDLPAGNYELLVDMHASNTPSAIRVGNQRLFAGKNVAYFRDQVKRPGTRDNYPMQTIKLAFTQTTDGEPLTIGVSTDGAPSATWFKVDNFRLLKVTE
ncbi:MAG: DUF5110 domain-containing protein [Bacteroidaceae bacterium]|nr:DUF5110 domain-containing protein [Bacteroidaceae bacterium]